MITFGGSGFGCEFPGVADGIIDSIRAIKMMDIEIETAKEELERKQLENYSKTIELIVNTKDSEIDYNDIKDKMGIVLNLNESLQFESNKEFATEKESESEKEEMSEKEE